ncbi:hypothetical protein JYQ62_16015 [Nostoc sp. UHCC 0702]|nr:hypothetical protein JYQ62_16015 [Nostoc sp. UHCC 0702]
MATNKPLTANDIEIDAPEGYQYKGKFHWSEVPGELYSAGMRLMTLNNFMLRKDGYTKRLMNKPKLAYFDVVFDKEFVYNRLSESLESLQILNNGIFDEGVYDRLMGELREYCASASEREREKNLRLQAEQMAATIPTRNTEQWYEFLKAETQQAQATATTPTKVNSKKPAAA